MRCFGIRNCRYSTGSITYPAVAAVPTSCGVIAQGQLPYHTLKTGLLTELHFNAGTSAAHSQAIDPFITSWPLLGVAEDA